MGRIPWVLDSDDCILLQPDGVQRGLVGNIISRFEGRGFKLIALKLVHATPEHLEKRASLFSRPSSIVI